MNKKFIRYQLKEWLPIFLIILVIYASIMLTVSFNYSLETDYRPSISFPALGYIFTPLLISTSVMPLVVYSYRFNKRKSDIYYLFSLKENELKNTRLILGLVSILIITTVLYWLSMLILGIRYNIAKDLNPSKYNWNWIQIIPLYFMTIVIGITNYFVSSYLINLGNNILDSIIYYFLGETILCLIVIVPLLLIYKYNDSILPYQNFFTSSFKTLCTFSLGEGLHHIFYPLLNNEKYLMDDMNNIICIICLVISIILGIISSIYVIIKKDPSGEYSGSYKQRDLMTKIIPYVAFFFFNNYIIINLLGSSYVIFELISSIILISGEYLLIALINRNFKLDKFHLTALLINYGLYLICYIMLVVL